MLLLFHPLFIKLTNLKLLDTTLWNTRTYKQGLPVDAKRIVSWTRRGQIWSNEDFKRLRDQFQTIWEEKFGNIERALTERADGRPVIFAS